MKWMIASDIHGSALYCRQMLEAWDREKAERLLLLGDVLYHGPRNDLPQGYAPKEVIGMLNARRDAIYCVRGNCEAEVDQMVLGFPVLADYLLLPVGRGCIYATHGHVYNEDRLPPMKKGDLLLHGHTHVSACREHETYVYCNPGSISIPKDSFRGYILLEGQRLTWKTLSGEETRTYEWLPEEYRDPSRPS